MNEDLKKAIHSSVHATQLAEIMDYAVLPAGKLFRPKLVRAISSDLNGSISPDAIHLGNAIELHHAYTLVHDDLPAMDNDLIRRGKPSTHAKFGEWKAILSGDALLISSFEEMMKITHSDIRSLHQLFTWATGARGLILGQFLDLEADGKLPIHDVIRVHELKTARLIQVATLGTHILFRKKKSLKSTMDFLRIGREIGVTFQLLDDLSELTEEVSPHEKMINPFITSTVNATHALKSSHKRLTHLMKAQKLTHLTNMMNEYFKDNQNKITQGFNMIEKNISINVQDLKNWITTFS
jgi:geranylgeranyl pyrophosphate synthase